MGNAINKLVYHPPRRPTYGEDSFSMMWLKTRHGSDIPACMIRHPEAKYTVLYSHGNAEDLGMAVEWATDASKKLEVNVFCYDYSGYGLASGKPSELHTYNDIEAAYDYLTTVLNVRQDDIILYGRSLGSGPTVHLAHKLPACANSIILHSPLASAYRVAWHTGFTAPGDIYVNIDKVEHIRVPVFVMHGTEDEVVPFKAGQAIYAKLQAPWDPWWVNGGGHNNLEFKWKALYYDQLRKFLRRTNDDASSILPC